MACPVLTPGCTLSGKLGYLSKAQSSSHGISSSSDIAVNADGDTEPDEMTLLLAFWNANGADTELATNALAVMVPATKADTMEAAIFILLL